jgi:hypothetical protein
MTEEVTAAQVLLKVRHTNLSFIHLWINPFALAERTELESRSL